MTLPKTVEVALADIAKDKSKVLGLTVGPHANIEPGMYIERAGTWTHAKAKQNTQQCIDAQK
jgi:hypothetical protein